MAVRYLNMFCGQLTFGRRASFALGDEGRGGALEVVVAGGVVVAVAGGVGVAVGGGGASEEFDPIGVGCCAVGDSVAAKMAGSTIGVGD